MKTFEKLKDILAEHKQEIKDRFKVEEIGIFGSYVRKMQKKKNKAGQILRQGASCLSSNKTPIGDSYRQMKARLGGKGAAITIGHKLARIIYTMLLKKTEYNIGLIIENQEKYREEKIKRLEKQLKKLKLAS